MVKNVRKISKKTYANASKNSGTSWNARNRAAGIRR